MALSKEKAARKGKSVLPVFIEAGLKAVPKSKKGKGLKKAKDNGEKAKAAKPVAEAIVDKVKSSVAADHAIGHKVKELRDTGMAWWQIAYQLELPGSGPNVAQGKAGAARARAAYKKTFGDLPGDVARRSTKASRASGDDNGAPVVRKAIFAEDQLDWEAVAANEDILKKVCGHEIRWIGRALCNDGTTIDSEREARVHPDNVRIERVEGKPTVLHFREYEKGDRRAQQWRSVRLADVYDIRR